jgi:predicted nucleotidyltransferase
MDKKDAITAAQRYVDMVSGKYPLVRALVFGSHIKGNQHPDSDIDVAVIVQNVNNLFDAQIDLMQLRGNEDLLIEPHLFRENDFDSDDPFVYEILRDSVELKV